MAIEDLKEHQFKPGQSGNPMGRPKGSMSHVKKFYEALNGRETKILENAIKMAENGNEEMMKFLLSRTLPAATKDNTVKVSLTDKNTVEQGKEVLDAVTEERITPAEGNTLMTTIAQHAKNIESVETIKRIEALEAKMGK